jgi:hypothetical protein
MALSMQPRRIVVGLSGAESGKDPGLNQDVPNTSLTPPRYDDRNGRTAVGAGKRRMSGSGIGGQDAQ